eukprot:gene12911-14146_t
MNDLVELTRLRFTITAHSENLDCNELTKLHQMFEGLKNLLLPVVTVSFQIEASIILGTTIQYFPEFPEDIFLMDNLLTGLKQLEDKDTLCSILPALGEVASSNLKRRDYLWFRDVESLLISLSAETEIRRAMLKALYSHLELKPLPTRISLTTLLPLLSSALEGTDIKTTGNAIFSPLIEKREKKKKVQKDRFHESVWLIVNVCMNSSPTQVQYLLNEHLLDALCEVLQHNKVLRHPIVAAVVESFEKMIKQAVTNIEDGLPDILTPFLKRYNLKQLFDELDDLPLYVT